MLYTEELHPQRMYVGDLLVYRTLKITYIPRKWYVNLRKLCKLSAPSKKPREYNNQKNEKDTWCQVICHAGNALHTPLKKEESLAIEGEFRRAEAIQLANHLINDHFPFQ